MKVSLKDLRNQFGQPLSTFRWSLLFITQPPMSDGVILPNDVDIHCESVEIPEYDYKTQPVKIRQFSMFRNSILTPRPINLKVIESTNNIIFNFFSSWQKATFDNRTGISNNKADLSCIMNLTLLDNNNNPLRNFVLFGCILTSYKRSKLNNTSDTPMAADIGITWDKMEETSIDLVSGAQLIGTVVDTLLNGVVPDYLKF